MRQSKTSFFKNRWWIFIIAAFLIVRLVIFSTLWQASQQRGGWENFYDFAQPAKSVLLVGFHDYCDWHPPLYYFLTSIILVLFGDQEYIYFFQIIAALIILVFVYRTARLFFSEKVALLAVFLMAIEPFWAWHNWLLVSDNLSALLFLVGIYYFFRFLKFGLQPACAGRKNILFSAIFLGLATLVRTNTLLLTLFLSVILILVFLLRGKLKLKNLAQLKVKQLFCCVILFNAVFFLILLPWAARNKLVYDRFTIANILSTNIYFYNLSPLMSWQEGISLDQAQTRVIGQADKDLGKNVGDQGDCQLFSKEEFNRQLDYYKSKSRQYILVNFCPYLRMHLFRALPFFLQSGYFDMRLAYTSQYEKPDITLGILKGDFSEIKKFFADFNLKLATYLLGVIFWGLSSLAVAFSLIYSYFKDKKNFIFFLISAALIIYSALVVSPFVLARYRLPVYAFFCIPLIYMLAKMKCRIMNKEL